MDEKTNYGEPAVLEAASYDRPHGQHPDDKTAGAVFDVDSRGSSSSPPEHQEFNPKDNGILAKLRRLEATLDRKLGVESQAIDRKLPEDRQPLTWRSLLTMFALWGSGTMNLSCFATGFLGWEFGVTLTQSLCICIFASLLGGAVSGFCATLGPGTGLRQISVSRYSFGWWPNKLVAALNTIQQIGWSAVGCITGGVALNAVADGKVSTALGIVIIAVCSFVLSFLGLKFILPYERWAWIVYLIIFIIVLAETGRYADNTTPSSLTGIEFSGTVLSLLAIIYGSSASWATVASDYYVLYPTSTSRTKVFILTALGIALPTSFGLCSGAVAASTLNNKPEWNAIYSSTTHGGVGFLIQEMLYPHGFAKFILVLLVLSGVNCNIINTYSAAISCQQFSRPFARIPRFLWTTLCFGVILALALAGRNNLLGYLQNFLALLGYWCTSYFVIVFSEHYIFRKGDFANYDLEGWNTPSRLPVGIAALVTFCLGVIAWVISMDETWFVGPVAKALGNGDIANEFTLGVSVLFYPPLRYLELKFIGR